MESTRSSDGPVKRCARENFIAAALDICDREGYQAITARNISKCSRHSTMALYRHFESMDHFLAAVWNECYGQMNELIWGGWDDERGRRADGTDRIELLRVGFRHFTGYAERYPQRFWFMITARPHPEMYGMPNLALEGFARMVLLIQNGMASGEFRGDLDPMMAAAQLSICLLGHACLVAPTAIGALQIDPEELLIKTIANALAELLPQP